MSFWKWYWSKASNSSVEFILSMYTMIFGAAAAIGLGIGISGWYFFLLLFIPLGATGIAHVNWRDKPKGGKQ